MHSIRRSKEIDLRSCCLQRHYGLAAYHLANYGRVQDFHIKEGQILGHASYGSRRQW